MYSLVRIPRKKMTPKETPKWKKFEALVASIQEQLSLNASVTLNEKMKGQRSDVLREVDITVRKWIGQFEIIVAIDCKDYVRPVDVLSSHRNEKG